MLPLAAMKYLLAPLLLLATACNREEQPQPPTQAETKRLDDAEAMLNELGKEEGAAPQGTAPSNSD